MAKKKSAEKKVEAVEPVVEVNKPVVLDINNPKHGNKTYAEL